MSQIADEAGISRQAISAKLARRGITVRRLQKRRLELTKARLLQIEDDHESMGSLAAALDLTPNMFGQLVQDTPSSRFSPANREMRKRVQVACKKSRLPALNLLCQDTGLSRSGVIRALVRSATSLGERPPALTSKVSGPSVAMGIFFDDRTLRDWSKISRKNRAQTLAWLIDNADHLLSERR